MIEQSQRPLSPSYTGDLDALQRRANNRRQQHRQAPRSLQHRWQQAQTTLGSPIRSIIRLPTRFLLHAVVALVLPLAVALSQIQAGVLMPEQHAAPQQGSADLIAPIAPLSLDTHTHVGDGPLDDSDEIPVPLSLISRSEALAPVAVPGTIAGERIFLRNGPGTQYDAVGRISRDTPVQVIGRFGDWYQVRESAGKPVYWVAGELLNLPDGAIYTLFEVQEQDLPAAPPPKVGTVTTGGLQLRDGPGTNYVSLAKFENGAQLELIESYQDWLHVGVSGGGDGWVKAEFLSVDPAVAKRLLEAETIPDPNPALVGVINDNQVNLRKGPDSKYDKVASFNAGQDLALIGKYNDWYQVLLSGTTKAWIFSDLLNVSPYVARRVPTTRDFPALPVRQTVARSTGTSSSSSVAAVAGPDLASIPASGDVASYALQFAGSRYVWGGASPRGFDCSGFTMYVYAQYGVSLPHSAAGQFSTRYGAQVGSMDNLQAGDLVFFAGTGGGRGITHVALYIGGGRVIHAMTPRYGVQVSNLYENYWVSHYYGAIRPAR